jgi:death on curing protein
MMKTPIFLTVEEVLEIHQDQIARYGGSPGVRDMGLLESAVKAPAATYGGEYLNNDLFEMAAAYLLYLVKNHAFIDGNKRVATVAADIFLNMNGLELQPDEPAFSDLVLAIATDTADKHAAAEFFRSRSRPVDPFSL